MLQIRSIEIFGFQAKSRKAKLQFASDQVSIIYGDNGCGKTTFLKVLHAVLDRKRPTLASERVRAVILKVVNNENTEEVIHINNISKIDDEGQITIDDYDFSELDQSCLGESSSLSLGVERGVTKQSIKIEYQDILRFLSHPKYRPLRNTIDVREFSETFSNYVRNLNVRKYRSSRNELSLDKPHIFLQSVKMENIESLLIDRYRFAKSVATDRIQNALFETLSLVITPTEHNSYDTSKIPDNFEELVLDNKERLIEALNDGIDNNFKSHVVTILHEVVTKRDA
ncbi:AAA family ATPase, partial [Vibrio sp. 10N.222.46.A1]